MAIVAKKHEVFAEERKKAPKAKEPTIIDLLNVRVEPLFSELHSTQDPERRIELTQNIAIASRAVNEVTAHRIWGIVNVKVGESHSSAISIEDLMQIGYVKMLRDIIPNFSEGRGTKFSTFLIRQLRSEFRNALARAHPAFKGKRDAYLLLERISVYNGFVQVFERPPKDNAEFLIFFNKVRKSQGREPVENTSIPSKKSRRAFSAGRGAMKDLSEERPDHLQGLLETEIARLRVQPEKVSKSPAGLRNELEKAINGLSDRQQQVMRAVYGNFSEMPKRPMDVAEKIGITPHNVSVALRDAKINIRKRHSELARFLE